MSNSKYPYIEQARQIIESSPEFKILKEYIDGHLVGNIKTNEKFVLQHFANELGIEIKILHR